MPPRILITRPQPEALQWVSALQARGLHALALPLLATHAPRDAATLTRLHSAQAQLSHYQAIMVVSGQAARHFFTPAVVQALAVQAGSGPSPRIWAPGPGTARVLAALGLAHGLIDQPAADAPQFDSEALWSQVRPQVQSGHRVLIVRGSDQEGTHEGSGRDWLAQQLQQQGAVVDKVVAYQRSAPIWTAAEQALAVQAASDGSLWLFSSSQAIAHLPTLLPAQLWQQAHALATHPRIAAAAQGLGFGTVAQCRPALKDVAASIESMP
ncbi:uroporphyrinogen-III synthase [Giesbergeria anulus]|uniref:Uroporphyrinogen-III synthase n=1 Tax=Giesbergeria anulus TaxID=180197 RepID=A0A1H9FQR3_9BURK|nr:uroporphyrinogen-III synthase [Giesbergeria anulus]SEQ40237.1 uroporphyrinogen-III synthase [Giesbergeria anulus]